VLKLFLLRFPFVETLWGGAGKQLLATERAHAVFHIRPERVLFVDHEYADGRLELSREELSSRC
jgi:hypothetical protein